MNLSFQQYNIIWIDRGRQVTTYNCQMHAVSGKWDDIDRGKIPRPKLIYANQKIFTCTLNATLSFVFITPRRFS